MAEAEDWIETLPEAAGLKFRLRFPDAAHREKAVLHVEAASLAGRRQNDLEALAAKVREHFAPRLDHLTTAVLEKLSGFYDRT